MRRHAVRVLVPASIALLLAGCGMFAGRDPYPVATLPKPVVKQQPTTTSLPPLGEAPTFPTTTTQPGEQPVIPTVTTTPEDQQEPGNTGSSTSTSPTTTAPPNQFATEFCIGLANVAEIIKRFSNLSPYAGTDMIRQAAQDIVITIDAAAAKAPETLRAAMRTMQLAAEQFATDVQQAENTAVALSMLDGLGQAQARTASALSAYRLASCPPDAPRR